MNSRVRMFELCAAWEDGFVLDGKRSPDRTHVLCSDLLVC